MGIEKAKTYLTELNLKDCIQEYNNSSAMVKLAVLTVGCKAVRMLSSSLFLWKNLQVMQWGVAAQAGRDWRNTDEQ